MKSLAIPETIRRDLETARLEVELGAASLARQDAIAACRQRVAPAMSAAAATTEDLAGFDAPPAPALPATTDLLAAAWQLLKDSWIWLGPTMVVLVGVFDLVCTISAYERGVLVEMNPIAKATLDMGGSAGLTLYRFTMTALGCLLLTWGIRMYRLRRFVGENVGRVRKVMYGGQILLVASHGALVGWWAVWFLYY